MDSGADALSPSAIDEAQGTFLPNPTRAGSSSSYTSRTLGEGGLDVSESLVSSLSLPSSTLSESSPFADAASASSLSISTLVVSPETKDGALRKRETAIGGFSRQEHKNCTYFVQSTRLPPALEPLAPRPAGPSSSSPNIP